MNILFQRNSNPGLPRPGGIGSPRFLVSALLLMVANACPLPILAAESSYSVEQAAESLRSEYRQNQWNRLAEAQDRDSLIAAVLLGMPDAVEHTAINGHAEVEQRLAKHFGEVPEVMFVLALACQMQNEPCGVYYERLTEIVPDNAVNWLLLPNGAGPDSVQLRSAAKASYADTHLRMVARILNAALTDQPAARLADNDNAKALALALRINAVERVPLPKFAGVVSMCKKPAAENCNDCIRLGQLLSEDRDGTILAKMVGSAMLRRLLKGTGEDNEAIQMRREYVWLSEQLDASDGSYKAQLRSDLVNLGEWVAVQHAIERLGKSTEPAPGWVPKDPQALPLPEDRSASPAK